MELAAVEDPDLGQILGVVPDGYRFPYERPSGPGVRLNGGRWSPHDGFATIYLSHPLAACIAELERAAELIRVSVSDAARSGRTLRTIEVHDVQVLEPDQRAKPDCHRAGDR